MTASVTAWINSDARGATTTPPMMMPVVGRQKSFTKPSRNDCIFERALPSRLIITVATLMSAESASSCVKPTVATSGEVKTFDDTCLISSGSTASPSEWPMAMRPCMAATDASGKTPVTSPAA